MEYFATLQSIIIYHLLHLHREEGYAKKKELQMSVAEKSNPGPSKRQNSDTTITQK
jgi:hypothetical protein